MGDSHGIEVALPVNWVNASLQNLAGSTLDNDFGATLTNAGFLMNDGSIQNSATFEVTATGTVTGTGSYIQTAGSLVVDGVMTQGLIDCRGGALTGTGTNSTVTNNGCTVAPDHSPGTLTIDGAFLFNSGPGTPSPFCGTSSTSRAAPTRRPSRSPTS